MTYTIRDDKGNMICSIENVDPAKSEEGVGAVIGISAIVLATIGLIRHASKKHKDKKLLKIINSFDHDKLEKLKKYIKNLDDSFYVLVEKIIEKNKSIIGIYNIPVLDTDGVDMDIKNVSGLNKSTITNDVYGVFNCKKLTDDNLKSFDKNIERDLLNKDIPETKAKIIKVKCYDDSDDDDELDKDTIKRSISCKIKHDPEMLAIIKELIDYVSKEY